MDRTRSPQFSIEVHERSDSIVLALRGELDMAEAPRARRAFVECAREGLPLIIDLRTLTFLDSMGLSALLEADLAGRDGSPHVSFVPGPENVDRVFSVVAVRDRLTWVDGGTIDPSEGGGHAPVV
jgi:anti-anti-sigma factor